MIRLFLLLLAVFFFLTVLRGFRIFYKTVFPGGRPTPRRDISPAAEQMVRDPVCGTWLDRRVALTATRGGRPVAVCSPECLRALEKATVDAR